VGGAASITLSPYIVVDQFGYPPSASKVAVLRDPQTGFDSAGSYSPAASYQLIDAASGQSVTTLTPASWNGGATDASSGDRAWRVDFSAVTTAGDYFLFDPSAKVRSDVFSIRSDVYREVLRHALRTFFYQRAGQNKAAAYAGNGWADGADHLGAGQDSQCRRFLDKNNAATQKDLQGGWFDAGDYNKYTSWTARYVVELLKAYRERPNAWDDAAGIPESSNGIPDVLDEAIWGLQFLRRMQNNDGSVLSIVGLASASPPSAASGASYYGDASTSATLATSAAFALGATVLASQPGQSSFATDLRTRAGTAWTWANNNPNVLFRNNDSASGTSGLGAGQQETDDYGRLTWKLEAAAYLFEATGTQTYKTFFEGNYTQAHLIAWSYAYPFEPAPQDALLYYASLSGVTASVATNIKTAYRNAMNSADNFGAHTGNSDPYFAYLKDYTWGSNAVKSHQGLMFEAFLTYGLDASLNAAAHTAAQRYVNYLHGVNPLGLVYLSNMGGSGAANSVNEFYHSWFTHGSALWDRVGVSTYGPPPGFLTGGPNPSYALDGCCPSGCGSAQNNALCASESVSPPTGQPAQKSYKDFNTGWPLDSWSVTENSDGYQVAYLRLLSKFVN